MEAANDLFPKKGKLSGKVLNDAIDLGDFNQGMLTVFSLWVVVIVPFFNWHKDIFTTQIDCYFFNFVVFVGWLLFWIAGTADFVMDVFYCFYCRRKLGLPLLHSGHSVGLNDYDYPRKALVGTGMTIMIGIRLISNYLVGYLIVSFICFEWDATSSCTSLILPSNQDLQHIVMIALLQVLFRLVFCSFTKVADDKSDSRPLNSETF